MKSLCVLVCVMLLSLSAFTQEIQEQSFVVNIEVPVRVYKGDTFAGDLKIDDFEVFEDLGAAFAVGVAAEDPHVAVGVLLHEFGQDPAGGDAREVGGPVVVGDAAVVPAGSAERWDVGQHQDVLIVLQRCREDAAEVLGGFVAEGLELLLQLFGQNQRRREAA